MAKLTCFLLLLLTVSAVLEVHAVMEEEQPKIKMPRAMLPKFVTVIIEKLTCAGRGEVCNSVIQCCPDLVCYTRGTCGDLVAL